MTGVEADLAALARWNAAAGRDLMALAASVPGIAPITQELSRDGAATALFLWLLLWTTWRSVRIGSRRTLVRGLAVFGLSALGSFALALIFPTPAPNTVFAPTPADLSRAVRIPLGGAWFALALAWFACRAPGAWALGLFGLGLALALPVGGYEWPLETLLGATGTLVLWALTGGVWAIHSRVDRIADDFATVLGLSTGVARSG